MQVLHTLFFLYLADVPKRTVYDFSLDSIFGTGGSSNRRPQQNALPLNMRIEVSENNRYMFRPTRSVIDVEYLPLLLMRMKGVSNILYM